MIAVWRRRLPLFVVLMTLGTGGAAAKECLGVNFPEQTRADGSTLTLNGLGPRKATLIKINVYVAALYVANPSSDPNAILGSKTPIRLDPAFRARCRRWRHQQWICEGFARNAKGQIPALQERIAMLDGWMSDLRTNQQMTFTFRPGVGVQVDVSGMVKGMVKGDDFAKAFLSIWLGNPPNPEIKAGLLGGACG